MDRQIARFFAFSVFDALVLIYPLYTLLFVHAGVSPAGVGVLLGVWSTTSFLLEIPTGVIADRYSRRNILFFSQLVRALGYAIWLFFPTFLGFLAGFVLWGVKSAFTHGTYQGLIYDHLKDEGREGDYARVIGRTKACSYAAIMLASVGASLAVKFGGYPLVLAFSVASGVIAALVIISLKPPRSRSPSETPEALSALAVLRGGLAAIWSDGLALTLVVFVAIVHGFGGAIDEYFPIFGSLAPIPLAIIPLFMAALSAAQAIVSLFVHRFEALPLAAIYLMFAAAGGLMVAASLMLGWGSLGLLCLFSGLYVIVSTTIEVKVQHLIPSAVRATATSVQGFVVEIATLSVYFGFGALAQFVSYDRAFLGFGAAIIAVGGVYLLLRLVQTPRPAEAG